MSDFDLNLDDDAMEWYFGSCNLWRSQANVVELAGDTFLSLSGLMRGRRHDAAVKRGKSLLMYAAALRQEADGIETRE
jgi:hypothetical protein